MSGQWANVNGKWVRKQDISGETDGGAASRTKAAPSETVSRGKSQPAARKCHAAPAPVQLKEDRKLPVLRPRLCPASGVEGQEPPPDAAKKEAALANINPSLPATISAKAVTVKKTIPAVRLSGSFPGGLPRLVQILRDPASNDDGNAEVCKKIANLCSVSPGKSSLVHDALAKEGKAYSFF